MIALFAFTVTIGSTYAWFTIVTENNVQSLSVTVQAQESLLIMMDDDEAHGGAGLNLTDDAAYLSNPANYVTTLTNAVIQAEYDFTSVVLQPITTLDGVAMTWRNETNVGIAGTYVEFNIWVLSQTGAVDIAIQDLSVVADNVITDKNAVVQAARLSLDSATSNAVIYGLDKDYEYTDIDGGRDSGDIDTVTALHGVYYLSSGSEVLDESTLTLSSASTAFSVALNTPTKISIRIWIEGWDGECTNNLSAAIFALGFKMTVK